ncbi:MAG: WG repeat-containing protein, partial [Oligoflexales bacterium]|nr:WG repeat-containing protein [Oligoflexales bacterium]
LSYPKGETGLASARTGKKWGFVDKTGKVVIEPNFDEVWFFERESGLARVRVERKFGYIDKTGRFVVNPIFIRAEDFSGEAGLAPVLKDLKSKE